VPAGALDGDSMTCGCRFDFFFAEGTYREYICDDIGPECGVHWALGRVGDAEAQWLVRFSH
jgi:hypothetical protein